ncbi:uncharacterized protein M6B38_322175 [Iris pallida]|uniref:Maternal effect embryo arrest 60 n=1 Tax=Iris pallida TaxID=29817 RepID=A0AAX6HB99_IRIPA|nr:uncharacterized protein M6B38_352400 [Iris pallida]KAJ6838002.1 uncharacterized protein M6B38_322175 [Iris pallida]
MEEAEIGDVRQRTAGAYKTSGGTSIHITALDGIVNVNSLFTLAIFVGLAWNPSAPTDAPTSDCAAGPSYVESMVCFHVYSFASFLFSSLVALCLKQVARVSCRVNGVALRAGILASAVGSFCGCGCLMLALVDMVQIKLGKIGCSGGATLGAVVPLVTLIPAAMLIYVGIIFYAFSH